MNIGEIKINSYNKLHLLKIKINYISKINQKLSKIEIKYIVKII